MTRSRYLVLCALVAVGAFAGGFIANRAVPVAHAQERIGPANVRGAAFTLVNRQGQVEATLRSGALGAELELDDTNGKPRVEINESGITILNEVGRRLWTSPTKGPFVPLRTE